MAHLTQTSPVLEDSYSASIDFSNSCREFYIKRQQELEERRRQSFLTKTAQSQDKPKSFMDLALEKLRKDMASMVDQDLSLMKTLMTMNETIEEIKFKRAYSMEKDFDDSSCEGSCWSVTDLSDSEDAEDIKSVPTQQLMPKNSSVLSLSITSPTRIDAGDESDEDDLNMVQLDRVHWDKIEADHSSDDSGYDGDSSDDDDDSGL